MAKKTYTEAEYKKILKRAAELESERRQQPDDHSTGGLTLDEIAEAASEAGIDPKLIYQAANETEEASDQKQSGNEAIILEKDLYVERLIDAEPNSELTDALVAELNHRFSDGVNDWHGNKPALKRYGKTVEWSQVDEWEMYERRVLLQPVGKKLRIRVSKRLVWGDGWNTGNISMSVFLPVVVVGAVIFGTISDKVYDSFTLGIVAALLLGAAIFPAAKYYNKQSISKHKNEVEKITAELVSQVNLMKEQGAYQKATKTGSLQDIEIPDEHEKSESTGLKNNLKERN